MKTAILSGATGQTASYLAELLLKNEYRVIGLARRVSTENTWRLKQALKNPRFELVGADITDFSSLLSVVQKYKPDEFYNLAAQSHVMSSFDQPLSTFDITGKGALNCLEVIKLVNKDIKFYQASSSEMFGSNFSKIKYLGANEEFFEAKYQDENTPFCPQSTYAVSKVAAHYMTTLYRRAYGLHANTGILFNHECISEKTPLLLKIKNVISIKTLDEIVALCRKGKNVQNFTPIGVEIWDGAKWTTIKAVTATKRRNKDIEHEIVSIQTRAGVVEVTNNHNMILSDWTEIPARELVEGDTLAIAEKLPTSEQWTSVNGDMAELLGHLVSEGYITIAGDEVRYTNKDLSLRERVSLLWSKVFLGESTNHNGVSGFTGEDIPYISLVKVGKDLSGWLRSIIYHKSGDKKVPDLILNADLLIQQRFIDGYYAGDGLKAGNGDGCCTNSAVLALGLIYIYNNFGRECTVYKEERDDCSYWRLNIRSLNSSKGQHLVKSRNEIRKKIISNTQTEFVFDIETDSQKFMAGVGTIVVHNSPRRGELFVTRKISKYVAQLNKEKFSPLFPKLKLGNINSSRDWGDAEDFATAIHLIMQHKVPDDFVICTGETHTVREFLDEAFAVVGVGDWGPFVEIDPALIRPAEVDYLRGDYSKAKNVLGWSPKVKFKELVRKMVEADINV